MANQQEGFYGAANQFGQQNLPNDFLESEDSITTDDNIQQRIISGEYAPEPAGYETYGNYEPLSSSQFDHHYAQEDPWLNAPQHIYDQEEDFLDSNDQYIYSEQNAVPSSSNSTRNNPFEEEDEDEETYQPRPITKIIPMRRIGGPPTRMVVISRRNQSDEKYSGITQQGKCALLYSRMPVLVLRRPINRDSSDMAAKRLKQPRKQQFRRDIIDDENPYL